MLNRKFVLMRSTHGIRKEIVFWALYLTPELFPLFTCVPPGNGKQSFSACRSFPARHIYMNGLSRFLYRNNYDIFRLSVDLAIPGSDCPAFQKKAECTYLRDCCRDLLFHHTGIYDIYQCDV